MSAAPGWYPDPAGGRKPRYWDGRSWVEGEMPTNWRPVIWLVGGFAAVLVAVLLFVQSGPSVHHHEGSVISTCQDAVRDRLKDPESAQFTGWTAKDHGGGRYTAEGLVNAKNGFGGYNGNRRYTCEATVDGKTVSATAHEP